MSDSPSSSDDTTPRRSLKANVSCTLFASVVNTACQWAILVVLARMGGAELIGQFVLGLAVAAPVLMFTKLELRALQATDARHEFQFRDYLGVRLVTTTVALVAIVVIVMATGYGGASARIMIGVALAKSIESLSDVFHGQFQKHERMDLIARSLVLRGPVSLGALALGLALSGSLFVGTLAMVFVAALVFFLHDLPSCVRVFDRPLFEALRPRFHTPTFARIVWRAAPLGMAAGIVCLQVNIPRFFVERELGMAELGVFASMAYVFIGADVIVVAINQTVLPRLARYFAAGEIAQLRRLLWILLGVGGALAIAGLLVVHFSGREILAFVYGAEYANRLNVFAWLAVSAAISVAFRPFDLVLRSMRYFWSRFFLQLASIGPFVVLIVVLIPRFGMLGAAYAVTVKVSFDAFASLLLIVYFLTRAGRQDLVVRDRWQPIWRRQQIPIDPADGIHIGDVSAMVGKRSRVA